MPPLQVYYKQPMPLLMMSLPSQSWFSRHTHDAWPYVTSKTQLIAIKSPESTFEQHMSILAPWVDVVYKMEESINRHY
jgi:hypothetical protein